MPLRLTIISNKRLLNKVVKIDGWNSTRPYVDPALYKARTASVKHTYRWISMFFVIDWNLVSSTWEQIIFYLYFLIKVKIPAFGNLQETNVNVEKVFRVHLLLEGEMQKLENFLGWLFLVMTHQRYQDQKYFIYVVDLWLISIMCLRLLIASIPRMDFQCECYSGVQLRRDASK